ncbi:integrase, catalytic region, zinc finger, CCHC-type containing protein [Tanacetum coccineum]
MELHDVSYGIEYVARPLLLFFSSENRLLWFRYREYDLAHLKLVFEFSIYKVWKSVGYGVSMYWIRRIGDFLEHGYAVSSLMDTTYWSSEHQHKRHANAERIMHERYPDPLALVANSQTFYNPSQSPQHSVPTMHPPPQQFTPVYATPIHHQQHHNSVNPQQHSISPQPYLSQSVTQQSQAKFPQLDSGLIVPMFQQREYPIECVNKAMAFLYAVASRFPPSNNQLRTSSNPRNQATIQDGRVTVQQIQGRQTQGFAGTGNRGNATNFRGTNTTGQPRVVKCYNCQGEGHMARQYPGVDEAPIAQQIIPQNATFQTEDLDAYDSDCDDLSSAKAVLMANLSSCDSDVLSEESYADSYPNDMLNQDVQAMTYSEQTYIFDSPDNEIHSDSNIIPYSQYLQET